MSHTWQIKVFTPLGTAKQTYSQTSAGFGPEITWDIEPTGNCLTGSFQAIPSMVDIEPRDLVQIAVDGDNKFFGYVTNGPNPYSKRLATYNLEGVKKLTYEIIIDSWWYLPVDGVGAGQQYSEGDLIPHRMIVDQLQQFLPAYLDLPTSDNLASLTSGNRGPIIAADYSLGDVLDGIIGSSYDSESYQWGIDADKKFFVKPIGTSTIDFRAVKKHVEYTEQNADDVCTSVRFVFSYPEGYDHPTLYRQAYISYGAAEADFDGNMELAPLSYEYEDATLVAKYGKLTKTVPLTLTDSWIKAYSLNDIATEYPSYTATLFTSLASGWSMMQTNTGATSTSALVTAISTPGTSTYVTNTANITDIKLFDIGVSASTPGSLPSAVMTDLAKKIWGVQVKSGMTDTDRTFGYNSYHYYADYPYDSEGINYSGIFHRAEAETNIKWDLLDFRWMMPHVSLLSWRDDPNEPISLTPPWFYRGDIIQINARLIPLTRVPGENYSDTQVDAGKLRIYEYRFLGYNTDALDGYGETFIVEPAEFPSQITIKGDLGFAPFALVDAETDEITTQISRVSHTLSPSMGYVTRYTTGRDDQRSNQFLSRMFNRDNSAQNTSFLTSTTRF